MRNVTWELGNKWGIFVVGWLVGVELSDLENSILARSLGSKVKEKERTARSISSDKYYFYHLQKVLIWQRSLTLDSRHKPKRRWDTEVVQCLVITRMELNMYVCQV